MPRHRSRFRLPRITWTVVAPLACVLLSFSSALADSVDPQEASFVIARWDTAAVAIAGSAYIYQGYTPPSETAAAFVYVPTTDTLSQLAAVYPGSRQGASAATDGVRAWTFGGEVLAEYNAEIVRHDLADQGSFTTLQAELPTVRAWTSAAWVDDAAYVLGGQEPDGNILQDVVRFEPATGDVEVVADLPTGFMASSAVAVDGSIYLFGGIRDSGARADDILRFDPDTATATFQSARLPSGRDSMGAATDGRYVYLFGGCESSTCDLKQILRYDTVADDLEVMEGELPTGRGSTSAVWIDGASYVFAGQQGEDTAISQIIKYVPDAPNEIPEARFELTVSGLRINVNGASSLDPEDDLAGFEWDWGDGSEPGTGITATHTYATAGQKTVTLTVTDGAGLTDAAGAQVTLTTSTQGSGGNDGPIVIWFPSGGGNNETEPSTAPSSSSPSTSVRVKSPSDVPRVDPLAPQGTSPGAAVGVFAAAVLVALSLLRRR